MATVEALKLEGESDCVAFTEFAIEYNKNSNNLYCFYEGYEDKFYYRFRITNEIKDKEYLDYVCGGKHQVLKVLSLITAHDEYKNVNALYFIDKDFDLPEANERIFETSGYSIENYYTSTDSLKKVLNDEFSVPRSCPVLGECSEIYERLRKAYHKKTILLNAFLACQAALRKKAGAKQRLNIDKQTNSILENIVLSDLRGIKELEEIDSLEKLKTLFIEAFPVTIEELNAKVEEFETSETSLAFRGKFELKFYISFLARFQNCVARKDTSFSKRYNCNLRFEYATSYSTLTQYADTPKTLIDYINKYGRLN